MLRAAIPEAAAQSLPIHGLGTRAVDAGGVVGWSGSTGNQSSQDAVPAAARPAGLLLAPVQSAVSRRIERRHRGRGRGGAGRGSAGTGLDRVSPRDR